MKAVLRRARISLKKANLVAGLVRKKPAQKALDILKFTPKKAAHLLYKVVHSAVSNAEKNFHQDRSTLYVTEIVIGKGMTLKRFKPTARGRAYSLNKETCHITVRVGQL